MTVTHNTSFVVSCLLNTAVDFRIPVAIFTMEMSKDQLMNRIISSKLNIDFKQVLQGNLAPYEWERLHQKIQSLRDAPIYIDDTSALSVHELRMKCRQLKAQNDIEMVIIDYLQLMTGDGNADANLEQDMATISRALKNLAKELNLPIIAVSQLGQSFKISDRAQKPQFSDLRQLGSIEENADKVLFLYRPDYYGITEDEQGNSSIGLADLILVKNRSGATGALQLRFLGRFLKFTNLEGDFPGSNKDSLDSFSIKSESKVIFEDFMKKNAQSGGLDKPPF